MPHSATELTATPRHPRRSRHPAETYDGVETDLLVLADLTPCCAEHRRLRTELIRRCLPLADHIARRFTGRGETYDDLYQIASLGVVLAVDRFDAEKGPSFLAFAIPTIMGEVRRHFRDHTWAVRVPRRVKDLQQSLGSTIETLYQRLKRAPTALEIARTLHVDLTEVTQALMADNGYRSDSLDTIATDEDSPGSGDRILALGRSDPSYQFTEDALAVAPLLAELPAFEARVLHLRFYRDRTQSQIAEELGVSQMQISRVLTRVLDRLRRHALDD